mmetsp:Transcript_11369/g.47651  ORF Transcript_11369/g.47651 Transcript_11369/m.47651 type:complete len:325 (-) Transcript_11369:1295-2269(-)
MSRKPPGRRSASAEKSDDRTSSACTTFPASTTSVPVSFAMRATKRTKDRKLSSSKSSFESRRNVNDAIGGNSAPVLQSSASSPSPRQLVMILSYASWSKRHSAFSPATFTPYRAAAARICRSRPSGPHREKNGCSTSRISAHVKFSRAPCFPQMATIGSYPSRSGHRSPERVLKYPAVSSAAWLRLLYHQCTPAHLIANAGTRRFRFCREVFSDDFLDVRLSPLASRPLVPPSGSEKTSLSSSRSNTERAHRSMRSPCSTSSPAYHDRKNCPYSLSQLPSCARKKPVSCGKLLYPPASCGPAPPHSMCPASDPARARFPNARWS